jgi:Dimethyladenosine transferase (rRNA methylation)
MESRDEKVILFGAGQRKDKLTEFMEKYGGFDIVEIWDNNNNLWGREVAAGSRSVTVKKPYPSPAYHIIVATDIYYDEIRRQLVDELFINPQQIKPSNYIYKNFKMEIINRYKGSRNEAVRGICRHLRDHELDMFNGQVKRAYDSGMFEVCRDEGCGLLYSYWEGKRIYLNARIQNERIAKEYLCSLCMEQDEESPHCYGIGKLGLSGSDIVIDGGAAEGFFALQAVEKVKKIYLVEGDEKWVEALTHTFRPYKGKVEIIPKWLGSRDDEKTVTIDLLNRAEKIALVKLDIEGAEADAIWGGEWAFRSNCPMKAVVCTYHATEDAGRFYRYFKSRGFQAEFSKGYLFVGGLETVKAELRKGVLVAGKE